MDSRQNQIACQKHVCVTRTLYILIDYRDFIVAFDQILSAERMNNLLYKFNSINLREFDRKNVQMLYENIKYLLFLL